MKTLENATAVILAGGLGTRLRPVVADRPKILASVQGRPFLARLLDQVAAAGLRRAVLCVGYRSEQVEAAFGGEYAGMRVAYSRETSPLGTGGALRQALPALNSDPVLVMNGDSFCHADLSFLWQWHHAHGAAATLLLTRVPDTRAFGRVQWEDGGRVEVFEEKGANCGPGWINAGIYVISRRVLEGVPAEGAVSLEREVFPRWIDRGLYGCPSEGPFLDIGTPASYAAAEEFFSRQAA
jgi:D-glycero-alpha-D-manno-heptose 1-phosphate guanylyltransferase